MNVKSEYFDSMPDGTPVDLYTISNGNGLKIKVIPYGCRLVQIWTKDRKGQFADILWGYDNLKGYLTPRDSQGAVIGRHANRICNAEMTIDSMHYQLTPNAGKDQLHGGVGTGAGFQEKLWNLDSAGKNTLTFSLFSRDGEGGFPGNMNVKVTYEVTEDDSLIIHYYAVSDQKTVINLTSHGFFNLRGYDYPDIRTHSLWLDADRFTISDDRGIPTGEIASVKGTSLDFTGIRPITGGFNKTGLSNADNFTGYDENMVIKGKGYHKAARLHESISGRNMEVWTDQPGIQLYTASHIPSGKTGKNGKTMFPFGAVCLETQHFPDAVHHPNFPCVLLNAGQEFISVTSYHFYPETE
jgi:aldose 1-epimerase